MRELDRVTSWLEPAIAAKFKLSQLAARYGVSLRQFERFIQHKYECPAHEFLHGLRMRHAAWLIAHGERVKDVTNLLGYTHATHLSREFNRFHGMSPSEFRRRITDSHPSSKLPEDEEAARFVPAPDI